MGSVLLFSLSSTYVVKSRSRDLSRDADMLPVVEVQMPG